MMPHPNLTSLPDPALLAQFLHEGQNSPAFAELARRHADLIYAAAHRLAPQDADDITQAVFLLLARKAHSLRKQPTLAPWLYKATRYCALNARKLRRRREHHERLAGAAMPAQTPAPHADLSPLAALLDEALAKLPDSERAAVLLRHLQNKSVDQTAADLAISPAAAGKRALRGLEKIRAFFTSRGFPVAAAALTTALAAESARSAPPALLASLPAAPSATAAALAAATAKTLSGAAMKLTAALAASAAAAAIALWAASLAHAQHQPPIAATAAAATSAPAPSGDLVVASYALLLEQPAADRLRALSTPIPPSAGQSNFYELRTSHMADIRKLLHDSAHNPSYTMAYDFPEQLPANPPPWQGKWGWQEFTMQQFAHDHFSTYISANLGEPWAQQSPGTAELQNNLAHLSLNFDNQQVQQAVYILNADFSTQTTDIPWLQTKASIHWSGDLIPGDAFLALGAVKQMPNTPLTIVALCETARIPAEEAQFLQTCQDTNRWLAEGPEGLRRDADLALVWGYANRLSHSEERAVERRWTRTISSGLKVSLDAIGDSSRSPFIWWDPAGNATVATRYNPIPPGSLALALHVASPDNDSGDPSIPDTARYEYQQIQPLPAGASKATLYIAGPTWTDHPIALGQTLTLPTGETVTFQKIQPVDGGPTLAEIRGAVAAPTQVSIAAITRDGKRILATNSDRNRTLFAAGNDAPQWTRDDANVYVKPADVDHWVLLTRKRQAVTFENFALRPQTDPADAKLDAGELHAAHLLASTDLSLKDGQREADRLDDLDALPRDPATPVGAMHLLVDAAATGNPLEVQKYLTGSNPQTVAAAARALAAMGAAYCRAEKKFGRVPLSQAAEDSGQSFALEESFLGNPWKIDPTGTTATTSAQRLLRTPTSGLWKYDVDSLSAQPPAAFQARLNALAAAANALSADLDTNKIPTATAAADRFTQMMQQSP
ncbi:MAG TPA: sigma-70 family RNA polymerase sigma factor [Phycisphaerae bacterium]|nr:sigma-70 family RNA polymerase sigma factor [Phycisphaerae bacterium]